MKTSELEGAALDWAVATAHGWIEKSRSKIFGGNWQDPNNFYQNDEGKKIFGKCWNGGTFFNPSSNWATGGPIIEREIHKLWRNLNGTYCAQIKYRVPYYSPTLDADIGADAYINKHGDTPLIAAMRCYVASKLGDEIEIPQELL